MNRSIGLALTTCSLLLLAMSATGLAAAPDEMTVGEFLVEMARTGFLPADDPATAEQALRSAGIALPFIDPDKPLTEGDVAVIVTATGLHVSTVQPDASYTRGQVDSLLASFGPTIVERIATGTDGEGEQGENENNQGNGMKQKKRKKRKTPKDPD